MDEIIHKIIEIINSKEKFVITTHVNPDGDAIGSELALARYIQNHGKEVKIINHSPTPDYLEFMINSGNEIQQFNDKSHFQFIASADVIFTLDLNQLSRTKSLENIIRESKALKICIDHHEYPENYPDVSLIDTKSSSTGELIYRVLKKDNYKIEYEIALPIYVAIMTDTGSFKYERTNANLHRIAAELLEAGVIPIDVHREIYEQGNANRLQLLGRALNSLKIEADGKLAYMKISIKDLQETDSSEEDVEGFVNYTLTIKGVEVGLFFFELQNGFKISFRSAKNVPVNKLASEFGGGGHFFAAGARIENKEMEKTISEIIEKAKLYINMEV